VRPLRLFPWLAAILVAAAALGWGSGMAVGEGEVGVREGGWQERGALSAAPSPTPARHRSALLCALSEQAAALTGSLALVGPEERPGRAREAAAEIRRLAVRAGSLEGGSELAGVLEGLADGLEGYAGGDPASLAAVREASARNARLREQYQLCSGGE